MVVISGMGDFMLGRQEDAHETWTALLLAMHNALYLNDDPSDDSQRVEETSLIYSLFGGYTRSQLKCNYCNLVKTSFESFLSINLDLSNRAFSVEECLNNFIRIEEFDTDVGYKCETCDRVVSAQKQLTIYKPPPVLVLSLKKFDMLMGGQKINKSILFNDELDLGPFLSSRSKCMYKLYGLIVHYGNNMLTGHYTAFILHNDEWYLFDDDKVMHM